MFTKRILSSAVVAAVFSASIALAAPQATQPGTPPDSVPARGMGGAGGGGGGGGGRAGRGAAAPANLQSAMTDMNRMLVALKADAADPTKTEQTMRNLAQFERDVAIVKMQNPPVNRARGEAPDVAAKSFHKMLTGLQRTLLDLEEAVANNKPDDIKKLIAQIEDVEKAGHTEFNVGG